MTISTYFPSCLVICLLWCPFPSSSLWANPLTTIPQNGWTVNCLSYKFILKTIVQLKYSWALHQKRSAMFFETSKPVSCLNIPRAMFSPFLWPINLSDSPVSILLDCFGVSCEVKTYCKIQVGSHNTTLNLRQKIDMVSYLPGISNPRTEVIFKIQDLLSAPNC